MAKSKKLTPQELYQARRQREESEKVAYLPPGLVNNGNTCFMNSTLQGLLATPILSELVHFEPLPSSAQADKIISAASRRSPLLTNGHGLAGEYERDWEEGMPLGDTFLKVMLRAWSIQERHKRESISPRDILTVIGRKYDQYLDFGQQDAHEFLRQLLDAMRMEELDIIKKRQPPPPPKEKRKKARRSGSRPSSRPTSPDPSRPAPFTPNLSIVLEASFSSNSSPPPPPSDDEKLLTFPDMLFGGQLASILVCEKCKKVSVTLEDFNDLSLSIKPEDYVRAPAKNKLRSFAKKLRFQRGSHHDDGPAHVPSAPPSIAAGSDAEPEGITGAMMPALSRVRSNSLPPSPVRRSQDVGHDPDDVDVIGIQREPRRRSIEPDAKLAAAARGMMQNLAAARRSSDLGRTTDEPGERTAMEEARPETITEVERGRVAFAEGLKPERKDKDKDNWVKVGRRISMKMVGLGGKEKEKDRQSRSRERGRSRENAHLPSTTPRPSTSAQSLERSQELPSRSPTISPAPSAPRVTTPPGVSRPSNPPTPEKPVSNGRSSPQPGKPNREEAEYLRQILAEIPSSSSINPFAMFHRSGSGSSATFATGPASQNPNILSVLDPARMQALWPKLPQLTNVDECLRMFTAVEVLDGENLVGCRRCWKIANGLYRGPKAPETPEIGAAGEDADADQSGGEDEEAQQATPHVNGQLPVYGSSPVVSQLSPDPADAIPMSTSAPSVLYMNEHPSELSLSSSLSSLPPANPLPPSLSAEADATPTTYGGLPIPVISTTGPDAEDQTGAPAAPRVSDEQSSASSITTAHSSLLAPNGTRRRARNTGDDAGVDESDTSAVDSDGSDSTSTHSDGSSYAGSSIGSPSNSRDYLPLMSRERVPLVDPGSPQSSATPRPTAAIPIAAVVTAAGTSPAATPKAPSKVPRSKQFIMRRAYKRYLIETPPPVLVIHLKRFQQVNGGRMPTLSFAGSGFSTGFKKLDDYVAFPEYLDLGPFLAPRREDYGLGKKKEKRYVPSPLHLHRHSHKKDGKCMYRLYAVIEHIGNMLGGHYVAYTALPSAPLHHAPANVPGADSASSLSTDDTAQARSSLSGSTATPTSDRKATARQWAYISDTVVRLTTLEEVLKVRAYMCMYERV